MEVHSMSESPQRKIGWIGLGNMGQPMVGRLLDAGYALTVYNRTQDKTEAFVGRGAKAASTLEELAAQNTLIFAMVYNDEALEEVALGDGGIFETMQSGSIFVDMSTVSPASSQKVAAGAAEKGIRFLRAPVTGSTSMAVGGKLGILASGDEVAFAEVKEIFAVLGQQSFYLGNGEEARYMKLLLNTILGTTVQIMAEALTFGKKAGLDWDKMLDVINNSAITSPLIRYKQEPLSRRDFSPAFTINLINKDFDLALDVSKELNIPMPVTSMVKQMLTMARTSGKGELDFISLVLLAEENAGLK
jgi:3-hydroxyisobutyrate dehydrogenase-like beta-hydroxyacid dehydrogenase